MKAEALCNQLCVTFLLLSYQVSPKFDIKALQQDLYHDAQQLASVAVTEQDGLLQVKTEEKHYYQYLGDGIDAIPSLYGVKNYVVERSAFYVDFDLIYFLTGYDMIVPGDHGWDRSYRGERLEPSNVTSERAGSIYDVEIVFPEVAVVVDATFMAGFKTRKEMMKYIMIEYNCINIRYRTVSRPKMRIWLRSIYITEKSKETYFAHLYGNVIDGLKSLYSLVEFVDKEKTRYEKYDIIFFVTGHDMAAVEGSRVETVLQGFAFVGSVCLKTRVGLGEDRANTFTGIRIMAHELAHTLGCSHDGTAVDAHITGIKSDSVRCPWEQGYLMSYIEENSNSMKFSSCCDYSMSLVAWSTKINCLHNISTKNHIEKKYNTSRIPGDILGRNKQCRMTYPTLKTTYFIEKFGIVNCIAQCFVRGAEFQASDSHWPMIIIDGTPCNTDKTYICLNGDCMPKERRWRYQSWAE
ncbi:hypothetical protein MRX96_056346 [Rhipicephalus microplus]